MYISNQNGSVLIAVVVTMTLIALLSAGVVSMSKTSIHSGIHANHFHKAQYIAESGTRYAQTSGASNAIYTLSNGDQFEIVLSNCKVTSTATIHEGTVFETTKKMSVALPSPDSPTPPVTNDLVSYWSFDDPCDQGRDDYGSNNGVINGATKEDDWRTGGYAVEFDSNGEFISVPDVSDLRITGEITLAAWVYQKSRHTNDYAKVISRRDGNYFYFLGVDDGKPYGGIGDDSSYKVTNKSFTMPLNEWHHIAFSYDDGNDKQYMYYDGFLIETITNTISLPAPENVDLSIGADDEGTSNFFRGAIDELFVYDRVLSLAEIQAICGRSYADKMHYRLNDNTDDDGGGENNGTEHGGISYEDGKIDKAASFDGVDDHILVSGSCLDYTGEITLMAWVKESTPKQYAKIISRRENSTFCFLGVNNGKPYAGIGDGVTTSPPSPNNIVEADDSILQNEWYHIAMTYSDTDKKIHLYYYYDGILNKKTVDDVRHTLPVQSTDLSIGADSKGTNNFFNGSIDEVFIYDKALTETEIQDYYDSIP